MATLVASGSQGPTLQGCPSPAPGSRAFSWASSAPFTCLEKLKFLVRDVIERGGRKKKKKKCCFHSAGKRVGSREKTASGSWCPWRAPPPCPPTLTACTEALGMGGSRPVRPYQAATAVLKMPLNKCFYFYICAAFDFQSRLQIRTHTMASRK